MPNPTRALVVIDVQREYFSGRLEVEHPPREESLRNIGRAIDAATVHALPVVIVQHATPPGAPIFARDTDGWELHPEIAARSSSLRFEKRFASALVGTPLRAWAEDRGIDTLTLVGYMTQNCVLATALDAAQSGLSAEVLVDATGSIPYTNDAGTLTAVELHRAATVILEGNFAAVLTTDEWARYLASGARPPRDNIVLSNQRARGAR